MAMTIKSWPPERREEAARLTREHGIQRASRLMGYESDAPLRGMFRHYGVEWKSPPPPPVSLPAAPSGAVTVCEPEFTPAGEVEVTLGTDTLVAGIGDLHAPDIHRPTWSAFLKWCRDHRPGVIYASELFEWASLSQHNGGEHGATWQADREAALRLLCEFRLANPNARIVLGQANHDWRLERLILDRMPALEGITSVPEALKLSDFGIEWVPHRVMTRIGRMKLFHGHQLEGRPDSVVKGQGACLPKHHTAKAVQMFGEPGWTLVYWHTHKGQQYEEPHDMGVKRAVNVPCMRTLLPRWLGPRVAGWRHGFLAAYVGSSGATSLYTVDAENGAFTWEGRRYVGAA